MKLHYSVFLYARTTKIFALISLFHTRLRAKLSRAVPLWNKTVTRVVVVEKRRPTFLLMTTHRDSKIYKVTRFFQDLFKHCQSYTGQANDRDQPWALNKTCSGM